MPSLIVGNVIFLTVTTENVRRGRSPTGPRSAEAAHLPGGTPQNTSPIVHVTDTSTVLIFHYTQNNPPMDTNRQGCPEVGAVGV